MKSHRLPKLEFEKMRENRKSNLSCHKNKIHNKSDEYYMLNSVTKNGDIFCKCCRILLFTKKENYQISQSLIKNKNHIFLQTKLYQFVIILLKNINTNQQ